MTRGGDPRVLHRRVIGVGVADLTSASVAVPARNGPGTGLWITARAGGDRPSVEGMSTTIADTDPWDRPRERLLRLGPDALSDVELVALLLGSGAPRSGVIEQARELLRRHGGLAGLAAQNSIGLTAAPGVGPAKATRIVAALALARRFGTSTDRRDTLRGPGDIDRTAAPLLAGVMDDRLVVIAADRASRVLGATVLPRTRAHEWPAPVRPLLAEALRHGAVTFALAHCCTEPTGDHRPFTATVAAAAEQCGLRLLDHVVRGAGH